jgi:hypothetical protein
MGEIHRSYVYINNIPYDVEVTSSSFRVLNCGASVLSRLDTRPEVTGNLVSDQYKLVVMGAARETYPISYDTDNGGTLTISAGGTDGKPPTLEDFVCWISAYRNSLKSVGYYVLRVCRPYDDGADTDYRGGFPAFAPNPRYHHLWATPDGALYQDAQGSTAPVKTRHGVHGYSVIRLKDVLAGSGTCPVHRLVYESYYGPLARGVPVFHIDSDKRNNAVYNLWSPVYSWSRANLFNIKTGVLTEPQMAEIVALRKSGYTVRETGRIARVKGYYWD